MSRLRDRLRITQDVKADIQWWLDFLPTWTGVSLLLESDWTSSHSMELYTDACGDIGFGAYWNGQWLQDHWPHQHSDKSIAWKELFAVVTATLAWGAQWSKSVSFFTAITWLSVTYGNGAHVIRRLYFHAAACNFTVLIVHIPGKQNDIADALSRFQDQRFRSLAPAAATTPTPIPAAAMQKHKVRSS